MVAIAGFQSLMNKHRANAIVNDAKVAYIESSARPSVADSDWQGVTYASESHKAIQIMRDKKGKDYVKGFGDRTKSVPKYLGNGDRKCAGAFTGRLHRND